jgi:hypothetical protein
VSVAPLVLCTYRMAVRGRLAGGRGTQISCVWSPAQLNFARWGRHYVICFMSPFWPLEFWGGFWIFRKFKCPCCKAHSTRVFCVSRSRGVLCSVGYTVWHCPLTYKACPTSLYTSCNSILMYIFFLLQQQFPPPLPVTQHKYYELFPMYTNLILLYFLSCFYYRSNVYWSRDSSVGMATR